MRQPEYDTFDPFDYVIARRLKNAILQFHPPASRKKVILFLAGLLRLPPLLNPFPSYAYSTQLNPNLAYGYTRDPWNDAVHLSPRIGFAMGFQ
jgi:hypothetical protein